MAYKIKWSPRAASNFEDICAYIAKDSEYYASLFAKKVNTLIKAIHQFTIGFPTNNYRIIFDIIIAGFIIKHYLK